MNLPTFEFAEVVFRENEGRYVLRFVENTLRKHLKAQGWISPEEAKSARNLLWNCHRAIDSEQHLILKHILEEIRGWLAKTEAVLTPVAIAPEKIQ